MTLSTHYIDISLIAFFHHKGILIIKERLYRHDEIYQTNVITRFLLLNISLKHFESQDRTIHQSSASPCWTQVFVGPH